MRFKQLEYFVAVAEAGSISKAATLLYIAQPSLSFQITTLEEELGGQLFDRLPRGMQLTAAGRAFLVEVRRLLAVAERAQGIVRSINDGYLGELRLATITSLAMNLVSEAAAAWRVGNAKVTLSLDEMTHSDTLEDAARSGTCDLAIGPRPHHQFATIRSLGFEEFVFVLPTGDPLLEKERINPTDIADRPWVMFAADHGLSQLVSIVSARWRISPKPAVRTGQVATALKLTAAGMGPTLLPNNCVKSSDEIAVRPLSTPVFREITAYADASFSPLAEVYLDAIAAVKILTPQRHDGDDIIYL